MVARMLLRAELRHRLHVHLAIVALLAGVAAALTLAAVIGRMATDPWERTWRATGAAHLTIFAPDRAALATPLAAVPGITASSGPFESGFAGLHAGRLHVETRLVERPRRARGPGRPAIVEGSDGGLLLERSFARRLGVAPGDAVAFDAPSGRRTVRVTGLAVVADQEPYPFGQPGLSFGSRALLDAVVPVDGPRFATAAVRLADPQAAPAIAERVQRGSGRFGAETWQTQRDDVGERLENTRVALVLLSALLVLCAAPIVATLVSERILARAGEYAILRAGGLTAAGLVAPTSLLFGVLGALGGVLGVVGGTLLAPLVTGESAELLAAPEVVGPAPAAALTVAVATAGLAALAAAVPIWLLSRRPAAEALVTAAAGGRRRPSRLARAARRARLPLPAVLGAGDAFARRPRALLAILALALSIAAAVSALAMEVDLATDPGAERVEEEAQTSAYSGGEPFDVVSTSDTEAERLRGVVYPGVAALLVLALANLVAVLALALREGRRDTGILRAVGLTQRDVAFTVVSRQLTLALAAVVPGIPLGLAIWWLGVTMSNGTGVTFPPAPALAAVAAAVVAACTLVTAPLARHAARAPVAGVLRQE